MTEAFGALGAFATTAFYVAGGAMAGLLVYEAARLLIRGGRLSRSVTIEILIRYCSTPLRLALPLLGAYIALPLAVNPDQPLPTWHQLLLILLILAIAYLLLRALRAVDEIVSGRLTLDQADNLNARRIQTQMRVIRGILSAIIGFGTALAILFTFPSLRQIGAGILASAGVAGIIVGLAAQRLLANLLAGFQVGFTQPVRLDDVVVVEGEWGRIEEITLTYVVVNIWDQRRLVLPISYFLEKPFANWTRRTSEIIGTVYFYVDYTAPIDSIRAELERIVARSTHWDRRVCVLHVTDARESNLELRALVSARDSGTAWDLRCEVREAMLVWLQATFPDALPRVRAELKGGGESSAQTVKG